MKKLLLILLVSLSLQATERTPILDNCGALYAQADHNWINAFKKATSAEDTILHSTLGTFVMMMYNECVRREQALVSKPSANSGVKELKEIVQMILKDKATEPTNSYNVPASSSDYKPTSGTGY